MKKLIVVLTAGLLVACLPSGAQKLSFSTDLLGCAFLGTLNAEVSVAVTRKWSVLASARYNPFTFRKDDPDRQFQMRQQSYAAGVRMWPWHTGSGWWLAGKLRYQEYNWGGLVSRSTREGDRFGAGIYAGYTHMLSPHLNLEFGAGLWSGLEMYRTYSCPSCGLTMGKGRSAFILPDDVMISVAYVF